MAAVTICSDFGAPKIKSDPVSTVGTWNVRSMNQGKLEVVKQEMAIVNVDDLGISKLKWTGMGEFDSVQFSSVSQSGPTLCDSMNRSTPGLPVHHQIPEFTQTDVH